jgi:hypothetical protein
LSLVCAPPWTIPAFPADDGIPVNRARYADHPVLPDFTAPACPDNPRGLEQVKGNLYRHTTGAGLAVHSGLVLATGEGAQRQLHTQSKLGALKCPSFRHGIRRLPNACCKLWRVLVRHRSGSAHSL